ncbi:MAG: cytochrome P450, partial [Chloroflexota bacterium]|nr:cytochrome P450 [Chloroflexota bacterium]
MFGSLFDAWRDPLRFTEGLARDYGDIASYRIGTYTGYLLNHPDHVRHVLQRNHDNYSKQNYHFKMIKPVVGEGLLTSDGEHWLQQRRLIQPVFHRRRINRFSSTTTRAALEMVQAWEPAARSGQPVDVAHEMMRLALRIVGEAVFSIDISSEAGRVGRAFATLNKDVAFRLRTVFVPPHWVPTPRNIAFRRARAELDNVVGEIIASRRRTSDPGDDLLGMVLASSNEAPETSMTEELIRDEVMTLLLAGYETTASLLAWTWYLLMTHPETEDALHQELDAVLGGRAPDVEDFPALDYTERVILESMRLFPPVWITSRIAT